MARDAMTVPRCRACKRRGHPLRYRTLFDCWYCPRCETARIRVIVNRKDDLGNNFSQRSINGYRTGYFLALRQICRG